MSSLFSKPDGSRAATGTALLYNKPKQTNVDDGLVDLVEALEEIDENIPLAKLNATSISDNNGGRILL